MSLSVQSIATDSNFDVRQAIGTGSGTQIQVYAGLIDRIHKDCLHSSVYSYLNIATTSFTTVPGQSSYTLTPTNIRRILGVFDATRQRILFPIERATSPISQVEKQENNPGQTGSPQMQYGQPATSPISLQASQPNYFRHIGAQQLNLYPAPPTSSLPLQLNVSYEQQVTTLVNSTDILLIPEDGRDMVVAGVNYLVNLLMKRMDEAQIWAQIYAKLKVGESLV